MRCSRCGEPARFVGCKLRFSRREDVAGWSRLRKRIAAARREEERSKDVAAVRARHVPESRLKDLASRPENPERRRETRDLRKRLDGDR